MDKLLYVAMSGAMQSMQSQNIHSHNLANVDTVGFKADFAQARSMPVFGEHYPSRVYAMTENPGVNYDSGPLMITGKDLDIAVDGEGWIAVVDAEGNEALTRSGELFIDHLGFVTTREGHTVMGNAGPLVVPPFEKLEIGVDGTVSIRALGQGPEALTELDRIKLVKPPLEELEKGLDGLFRRKDGLIEDPDFTVRLVKGALERSNVNAVESLLSILSAARQFELQVKMMEKSEEMDASAARVMQFT